MGILSDLQSTSAQIRKDTDAVVKNFSEMRRMGPDIQKILGQMGGGSGGGGGGGYLMSDSLGSFSSPPPSFAGGGNIPAITIPPLGSGQQGYQAGIGMQALPTGQGNSLVGSAITGKLFGGKLGGGARTALGIVGGLGATAGVLLRAAGSALPDLEETIGRQTNFYQAALRANVMMGSPTGARGLQGTVFGALEGGITSRGSDAQVAAILANQGMVYSEETNSTYMQTLRGIRNSATYLNMDNASAALAIEGMTSGAGSMNMLSQFGIHTSDPRTGKAYTQGQIFEQIAQRLTAGRGQASSEETLESIRRGNLGETIRNIGLSTDQQEMFKQFMVARTSGNMMDVSSDDAMRALQGDNLAVDRINPQLIGMEITTEDTRLMKVVTDNYIEGMKKAAETVNDLRMAMELLPSSFVQLESFFSTLQGSQTGKFVEEFVSSMPGAISGLVALGAFSNGLAGWAAGFAESAGVDPGTGYSPVPGGTYTPPDMGSGKPTFKLPMESSTVHHDGYFGPRARGQHNGLDFPVPVGTPVKASADGVVSTISSGGGFGVYVIVTHSGGYSSLYAHLTRATVGLGTEVGAGQQIAVSGNTGDSTGPHLHLEIRLNGAAQNPAPLLGLPTKTNSSMTGGTSGATGGTSVLGSMDLSSAHSVSSYGGSGGAITTSMSGSTSPGGLGSSFFAQGGSMGTTYLSGAPSAKTGDAYVANDGPVNVHAGEAILTTEQADDWRSMMRGSRRGGGNNVTINVQLANANDSEARRLATMVKQYLEEDSLLNNMGRK
jgi:hypothetical protein